MPGSLVESVFVAKIISKALNKVGSGAERGSEVEV